MAGLFPGTISAWDTRWLLDDQGFLGGIAGGLLGYSSAPSLLQVMFYAAYIAVVGHLYLEEGNATSMAASPPHKSPIHNCVFCAACPAGVFMMSPRPHWGNHPGLRV